MTIEAWTRAPLALIQTQGPYTIPHPYASGAIRAIVLSEDGLRTELLPTDYTITPEASADTGSLTLTPAAFAIHEGRSLIIDRVTPEEQGWVGRLGQRERGLEAQLDLMVMAQQENRGGLNSALRLDYAVDPLPRVPNTLVGLDGQGQPTMYELADPAVSIPVARYERVVSGDGTATPLPLPALAAGQGVVELYIWGIRQSPSVYRVTGGGRYVELRDGAVWPKGDQNIHIVQSSALVAAVESGEIFNSLEEAAAASIVAVRQHIAVLQDGRLLTYIREAGVSEDHAALITADGARWVPAAITARYNPASWGSGWTALWRCWEWQKAARGRIDLEIPPGMTITQPTSGATDYVTLTALNVPISFVNLGRIIRMALAPVFAVAAGYVQPVAVTGILESETTVTLPEDEAGEGGTSTETQKVTTITLASLAGYEATTGMIAYITDDDATPLNPDGTPVLDGFGNPLTPGIPEHIVRRRGEPFVIWRAEAGTSGSPRTDLIVRKPLNFTYRLAANCRVWLLRTTPIEVMAGNIEDGNPRDPGNPAYQPMIHIEAAQYPRVTGLVTEYSGAHAVQFLQCYEPVFKEFRLGYIANQNNPWHTSGLARYGARFVNCAKAQVSDGMAGHVRHVVDFLSLDYTGFSYLKPDASLHPIGSGASMDCTVTDVLSWGATAPPFSTHDGTFRIKFANCHAIKPASWGFASRGVGHVFDGCSDTDANGLIHCFVGGRYIGRGTAITRDISVRNHTSINPRGMALVKVNDGCQSVMLANMVVRFTEDGTGLLQRIADIRTAADVSISGLRLDIRRPQGMDELFKISGTGVGGVIRWTDSEVIDWTGTDTITNIIDNAGPAYLHMIGGVRAYRADTQGQLIGALWTGTAPAAGSHIRDSRIVGLWSEDEVAPDRATVLAGYVSLDRSVVSFRAGDEVISLVRKTGGTAATFADGSTWEAEGPVISPLSYGAVGDGTTNDTDAIIAWLSAPGAKLAHGRYRVTPIKLFGVDLDVSGDWTLYSTDVAENALLRIGGEVTGTTTLSVAADAGDTSVTVTSATGIAAGSLLDLVDEVNLWPADNRGELHPGIVVKVASVSGTTVKLVDALPLDLPSGTVVTIKSSPKISIRGRLKIERPANTAKVYGLDVYDADTPFIERLETENCGTIGGHFLRCYKPRALAAKTYGSNRAVGNAIGYGFNFASCYGGGLDWLEAFNCRRGVDVGGRFFPSWFVHCGGGIVSCGGLADDGSAMWPDGTTQADGIGTHGGAFGCTFENFTLTAPKAGIRDRGIVNEYSNIRIIGKTETPVSAHHGDGMKLRNVRHITGKDSGADVPDYLVTVNANDYMLTRPIEITGCSSNALNFGMVRFSGTGGKNITLRLSGNHVTVIGAAASLVSCASAQYPSGLRDDGTSTVETTATNYARYGGFIWSGTVITQSAMLATNVWRISIADDEAVTVPAPRDRQQIDLRIFPANAVIKPRAQWILRQANASPVDWGGTSGFTAAATALTGTTGTDGNVTASLVGGLVYVENRSGAAVDLMVVMA